MNKGNNSNETTNQEHMNTNKDLFKPRTNTAVLSARADVRHLAAAAWYLDTALEHKVESRSDLVYRCVELVARLAERRGWEEMDTAQAEGFLARRGIKGLNTQQRNSTKKKIRIGKELEEQERLAELEAGFTPVSEELTELTEDWDTEEGSG